MAPQRKRGTVSPTLLAFGRRFKRFRDANGWSQEAAAARANGGQGVTSQYIGAVENGRTRCTFEFAEGMDAAFGAEGQLVDLWHDFVEDATFPEWFDWLEIEAVAAQLQSYQPLLVHGLVQTSAYASALLRGNEKKIEGRLKRQEILRRDEPPAPIFSLLLDQVALERPAGDAAVMQEQLDYLADVSTALPNVTVQVVPSDATHDGNGGGFTIATLADRNEFAYSETAARGFTMTDPDDMAAFSRVLIQIRGLALPVSQSLDLIRRTRDDLWKT